MMTVLWLALGFYIVGVAIVLYIRPKAMFHEGGWKEFGLANTSSYTIFPFWMFTLVWAVLSYAFATLSMMFFASSTLHTIQANTPNVETSPVAKPISKMAPKPPKMPKAPKVQAAAAPAVSPSSPGYYVLDTPASGGPPRYVYYGPEPPSIQNLERFAT
jgi:hypothetical protein